ncbi:glutathione S-transferase family protein [Ketobacter sp. MCCC 1A13808]|nr:glutathione S-transferase family protein [Ketobacter sp. MCCC 1A13808]
MAFYQATGAALNQLILHNYPLSPFSEKIRSMLGYTKIPWQSANTREAPPRPILEQLAGGYRKVPVAQIGADIFCDTRTISAEIAAMANMPELIVENADAECQAFVEEVEQKMFFATLACSMSFKLNKKVLRTLSVLDVAQMMWDRIKMGRHATVKMAGLKTSKAILQAYLEDLENQLSRDFIFGNGPSIADFAAYHSLWFYRDLAEKSEINKYHNINRWMDRIKQFGHGKELELDPPLALEIARNNEPRPIEEAFKDDPMIGKQVLIAPSDYAQTASQGTLVGSKPHGWIIARQESSLGTVHVHFPRHGFTLTPV